MYRFSEYLNLQIISRKAYNIKVYPVEVRVMHFEGQYFDLVQSVNVSCRKSNNIFHFSHKSVIISLQKQTGYTLIYNNEVTNTTQTQYLPI